MTICHGLKLCCATDKMCTTDVKKTLKVMDETVTNRHQLKTLDVNTFIPTYWRIV